MTSDATISAHPKALGRLIHPRDSRSWRLSSYTSSCRNLIGRYLADAKQCSARAPHNPVVSNQPRSA
jgi:hypothetical protein